MLSLGERWQLWAEALPPARPAGRALGAPPLARLLGRAACSAMMLWASRWWDPATCYKGLVDKWDAASSMHQ